ncbi:hypothetical protein GCM10010869_49440 [Mesorhizobium tianshanense]|nr:hypothetical protein GCM10010869_49440 [Mesorhizobium tianshanense]
MCGETAGDIVSSDGHLAGRQRWLGRHQEASAQIPAFTDLSLESLTAFIREHKPIAAAAKTGAQNS